MHSSTPQLNKQQQLSSVSSQHTHAPQQSHPHIILSAPAMPPLLRPFNYY